MQGDVSLLREAGIQAPWGTQNPLPRFACSAGLSTARGEAVTSFG